MIVHKLSITQLLFWLHHTPRANPIIHIACLYLTDQGDVSQAIVTSRMQRASLIMSYLASYSNLLAVRLSTTVPPLLGKWPASTHTY